MKDDGKKCCGGGSRNVLVFFGVGFAVILAYGLLTQTQTSPAENQDTELVDVTVYSDFKCPYCSRAATTVEMIRSEYGGQVNVEFRHFPLDFHEGADLAAQAAECARNQGMFWEYHDQLFEYTENGFDVGQPQSLDSAASEVGLDTGRFNACLQSGQKEKLVEEDIRAGKENGVRGTPTFFIEGEKIVGAQPYTTFESLINEKLGS